MSYFLIALQFLTPLRIGKIKIAQDEDLAKSMAWFGISGLLIGILLALAYSLLSLFLPKMVVAAFVVLLMIVMTGGLHLDGLADTVDGLAGGKDRNDILRIMHGSNIGAIGAAFIFICLLIKFSCLNSLTNASSALILSSNFSRWAFVFSSVRWPAAADNEGLGAKFMKFAGKKELFWTSLTLLIATIFTFGLKGIAMVIFAILFVSIFNNFIRNKISGLTGDTLGAVGELSECFILVLSAIT